MMKPTLTAILAATLALSAGAAAAQSIQCGQPYTVQRGDTLSQIADRAYGEPQSYQLIYSANAAVIGPNPGIIEVASVFNIPCLDAPLTASTASAAVIRQEDTTERLAPAPAPNQQIRFVTATDWAPFHDQNQEQGGMLTEIVNVAMSKVRGEDGYKIDFINDWSAHLQPLISDGAYDISLAWFRPNCDVIDRLGEGSQFRCNNLDWSEPLYEQIVGYYTRADAPAPVGYQDLFGRTVCRPAGYSMFMMEEHELVEPNITLAQPGTPDGCFQGLVDGSYDVVVLSADVADGAISELGATDTVIKHDALDSVATIHAVTSKNNPNGLSYIAELDDGLRQLKDSGEWFEIVRRHLAEHRMKQ